MRRVDTLYQEGRTGIGVATLTSQTSERSGCPYAPKDASGDSACAGISRQGVIRAYRRYAPIYDWMFGVALRPGAAR